MFTSGALAIPGGQSGEGGPLNLLIERHAKDPAPYEPGGQEFQISWGNYWGKSSPRNFERLSRSMD
jgi:hypothetical protein